jgi:hypothetical protein
MVCVNKGSGWFLPSNDELGGGGNPGWASQAASIYSSSGIFGDVWTSTEQDVSTAIGIRHTVIYRNVVSQSSNGAYRYNDWGGPYVTYQAYVKCGRRD